MHTENKIKVYTVLWIIMFVDWANPLDVSDHNDNKGKFILYGFH